MVSWRLNLFVLLDAGGQALYLHAAQARLGLCTRHAACLGAAAACNGPKEPGLRL